MTSVTIWLHLLGVAVSLGSAIFFAFAFYPSVQSLIEDRQQRVKMIANSLKVFHPLFLFGICLNFMSGAIRLTDLKVLVASQFGAAAMSPLEKVFLWKFGFTMMIFLIAGGQCFGMGLKLTRMANGVMEGTLERQEKLAGLIRKMTIYNIFLLSAGLYVGLKIIPIIYGR